MGLLLHVLAGMCLVSGALCWIQAETADGQAFLWTGLAAAVPGQLLVRSFRHAGRTRLAQGMLVAAFAWLVLPILGSLPFLLVSRASDDVSETLSAFRHPVNALFESFSGFTGTGLTMARDASALPASLLWWRALTEWVGGVGVIVLLLAVVRPTADAFQLYYSEGRDQKILPSVASTVRRIWAIYAVSTAACVGLLVLSGRDAWESLLHAMTAVSTGGFSIHGDSAAGYGDGARWVLIAGMIFGAISFTAHDRVLRSRRLRPLLDAQGRTFAVCLVVGATLLLLDHVWAGQDVTARDSLFQWVSALTTAGFETVDLGTWTASSLMLLTAAMVVGGAAGSTVGGLKSIRLYVMFKGVVWRFRRVIRTRHELPRYELDGEQHTEADAMRLVGTIAVFSMLWLFVLAVSVFALVHFLPGQPLERIVFEVASAQANCGLSAGITGPDIALGGKLVLIGCMWVGRLEILPVVLLIGALTTRRQR